MQYLYLIHCRNGLRDFYKVGVANDVESRLAQLQTGNPLEMKILGAYGFDNAEIPERAIHQAWKKQHVRGEWFEGINPDDVYEKFRDTCVILDGEYLMLSSHEATPEEIEDAEEESQYLPNFEDVQKIVLDQNYRLEYRYGDTGLRGFAWRRRTGNKECVLYVGKSNPEFGVIKDFLPEHQTTTQEAGAIPQKEAK